MAGEINRPPEGLLSLLDLSARGSAPRLMAPDLQTVIDTFKLYTFPRSQERTDATANTTATGFWPFLVSGTPVGPSETEMWYMHAITVFPNNLTGAGSSMILRPAIGTPQGRLWAPPCQSMQAVYTVGDAPRVVAADFWVKPGNYLGVFIERWALLTANPSCAGYMQYTAVKL